MRAQVFDCAPFLLVWGTLVNAFGCRLAAALLAVMMSTTGAAEARYCKALKGEMVDFGEQATRTGAEEVLGREIAAWETKTGLKVKPAKHKTVCGDYIKFLNEFQCTAEAVVCR